MTLISSLSEWPGLVAIVGFVGALCISSFFQTEKGVAMAFSHMLAMMKGAGSDQGTNEDGMDYPI